MMVSAEIDPRFRRLNVKLGVFIGLALLLGIGLLLGLAVRQGYFSAKTPVFFEAASGSDLRVGMAVKLSGFKIGTVRRVELNQQAKVDVEMQIEDRYMQWIKSDSVATLAREGMIGDSFIALSSGNSFLPALSKEDRLRFVLGSSLGDIALDVRNRVVPVIDELHGFLRYANDPRGDVRGSFSELHKLTVELHGTRQKIDATLQQMNQLAGTDVPATLAQSRATLLRADASMKELEKAIPALSAEATRSLQSLSQASDKTGAAAAAAQKLLDDSAPRLNGALTETEALMKESRSAIGAARTRWPFKGPDVAPAEPVKERPLAVPVTQP